MTTRAEKIIEGFKLGSLGAGTKKFVNFDNTSVSVDDVKRDEIKILKTEIGKKPDQHFSVIWQDRDGYVYSVEKFSSDDWDTFFLWFRGKKARKNDPDITSKYPWVVSIKSPNFEKKYIGIFFEQLIHTLKEEGIAYFLSEYSKKRISFGSRNKGFKSWLDSKVKS
jgi:hypothetical protein